MTWFGYRLSMWGPPLAFKTEVQPSANLTPVTRYDHEYPNRQIRKLTDADAALTIDALKQKFPYVREA